MVKTPTVLILGAGASMDYGFPSGNQLLNQIIAVCTGSPDPHLSPLATKCQNLGFSPMMLKGLGDLLTTAPVRSIDAFLEKRDTFLDFGKFLIAQHLVPSEDIQRLFSTHARSNGWYQLLWDALDTSSFTDLAKNQLSICTFNYDRSLEHFLHMSARTLYNKPPAEVAKVLSNIPIIHFYGQLGDYSHDGSSGRAYVPDDANEAIKCAMKGIRIISEDHQVFPAPQFANARKLFSGARRIVFLGFGYHPTNVKRLGLFPSDRDKCWGTARGMSPVQIQQLNNDLGFLPQGIGKAGSALSIAEFLSEFDVLS